MTKLTSWKKGPTQELPNQLVLQTGHRNTLAKSVPWTPNATNCCKWTCCSDLPIWQALYQPGMVLLPRWTTEPKDSPNQPPTIIYKTAAKEISKPRSQDNTPGRQFRPQVEQRFKRITHRPPPIALLAVAEILDGMHRPLPKRRSVVACLTLSLWATAHCSFGSGLW